MAAFGVVAGAAIAYGFARSERFTVRRIALRSVHVRRARGYAAGLGGDGRLTAGAPCHRTRPARFASQMKLQIDDFRLQIEICNQSEICNLNSAIFNG
jgi:hypothetical protein